MTHNPRRQLAEVIFTEFRKLEEQSPNLEPELIGASFRRWTLDTEGAEMSLIEARDLRRRTEALSNACSDRSGSFADLLPLQLMPTLILNAAGFVANQVSRLPPWLTLAFIVTGFAALLAVWRINSMVRRWKSAADAMQRFESALAQVVSPRNDLPSAEVRGSPSMGAGDRGEDIRNLSSGLRIKADRVTLAHNNLRVQAPEDTDDGLPESGGMQAPQPPKSEK